MLLDDLKPMIKAKDSGKDTFEGMYNYVTERIDLEMLQPQFKSFLLE